MEKENALKLSILCDDLKRQLVTAEAAKENQDLSFQNSFQDLKHTNQKKIHKSFFTLNSNNEQLFKLYDTTNLPKNQSFFYQLGKDEVSTEEDAFTSVLTLYTRKQFFDGIGELAGGSDTSRYDLLDINKPETLLIKGDREEIRQLDRKELQRLKSQYAICENEKINAELQCVQLRRSVTLAEKQLQQLSTGTLMLSKNKFKDDIMKLEDEINRQKQQLQELHRSQLQPLLVDLQGLHSAKVLQGNYDLKLARQNYFLSKQDNVIEQLLGQCARNYFRSMLYEIDLKEHRNSYHLLLSSKSLIEKEVENIKKRINYLSDPMLLTSNKNKETISSRDELVNKLYDALVNTSNDQDNLYKTYESLKKESKALSSNEINGKRNIEEIKETTESYSELLQTTLDAAEKLLNSQYSRTNEELTSLITTVEDNLSIAEHQVNGIIKDIVRKRKILSTDSLKVMERSIFANFFNDPARLKTMLAELESRVNAFSNAT